MQYKQKIAYMALGGVLVLAGHVLPGLIVGPATAQDGLQDAEFGTITARRVIVHHPGGGVGAFYAGETSATLSLRSPDGNMQVHTFATDGEATLTVNDLADDTRIFIQDHTQAKPNLAVVNDDETLVSINVNENGGVVVVADRHGEPEAALGVDENGDGFVIP